MKELSYRLSLIWIFLLACLAAWAQPDYPWLRFGDQEYQRGAYTEAETAYRKALESKVKPGTAYNLGNSIYQQNRLPEAIQQYQAAIQKASDPDLKAKAYYNLGNAFFQQQDFEKSIQAYKESLKLEPGDEEAKKNLMLAMRQLQMQQQENPPQEQDQQQDSTQEKEESGDPESESSPQNQTPSKQEQQAPENLSQDEAREILKAIEREDQRVQEKLKKSSGKTLPPVKDW